MAKMRLKFIDHCNQMSGRESSNYMCLFPPYMYMYMYCVHVQCTCVLFFVDIKYTVCIHCTRCTSYVHVRVLYMCRRVIGARAHVHHVHVHV